MNINDLMTLRTVSLIEGRISVLMRPRHEALPCRRRRALRFVSLPAVLANNLMIIGELLTKRSRRRRKPNRQFLS
jgi:hypothetical protein